MCPMGNVLESFQDYMAAANLEGLDRRVTIRDVIEEQVQERNDDGGEDEKSVPILYIEEHKKGIRLNKTMATQLVDMFGTPDANYWIGKQITIYPTRERYFGKMWDVIRIRDEPTQAAPQQEGGFANQQAAAPAAQTAPQPAQTAQTAQPNPTPAPAQQNAPAPAEGGSPSAQPANALTREQAAANQQAAAPQEQPAQSSEWFDRLRNETPPRPIVAPQRLAGHFDPTRRQHGKRIFDPTRRQHGKRIFDPTRRQHWKTHF